MRKAPILLSISFLLLITIPVANAGLIGPSAYLSSADSPFSGVSFDYSYLETFEDNTLTQGVNASAGASYTSGVDGDYVVEGTDQRSFYQSTAVDGITFTFSETLLGSLPTHAGIVWTDSRNDILFEAFDSIGNSLGTLTGNHADAVFSGNTTAEDRFYGVINATGISSIFIKGTGAGGLEVDHLQYGLEANGTGSVPEPTTLALMGFGLAGIGYRRKKQKAA